MSDLMPKKTRIYRNHTIDSERWNDFPRRPDDIIVATPYKCGTTWMQAIALQLVFGGKGIHATGDVSPWIDNGFRPQDEVYEKLAAQTHRRVLKTHTPLDGFSYDTESRYIVVGRDPRDVFMSMWNHYSNYTPEGRAMINDRPDRVGAPQPDCPEDIRELWDMWINRGWFPWETEGYPFWTNFHHVQTWWDFRHLPNIRIVHYNNLLNDLEAEITGIADFLNIDHTPELIGKIAEKVTFSNMKKDAEKYVGEAGLFKGGADTFVNKGTNGRWRSVLNDADLQAYDRTAARTLSPDCRAWLETGVL